MFKKVFRKVVKPRVEYNPLIKIFLHKTSLLRNYQTYKKYYPNLQIAPVLKSNAYGHGLAEVASVLDSQNPPFLAVDSFFEALVLRQARIHSPILVIGYVGPDLWNRQGLKDTYFSILGLAQLQLAARTQKIPREFHLKIDTGMHRYGILPSEFAQAISLIQKNKNLQIRGIFSHLADAYSKEANFSDQQIKIWNDAVGLFQAKFPRSLEYWHLAATAGIRFSEKIKANTARIGMGLYGIDTSPSATISLDPVLEMKTVISSIKQIGTGEKVGYSLLFESPHSMKIATIPAGYNEGVDLRLTNKGVVEVKGKFCPIIGRVSMNVTTIDISAVADAVIGDEAKVISRQRDKLNSVESIAGLCNTSPYEIFVHLPGYLRREVV